jgi:hypothetical protein
VTDSSEPVEVHPGGQTNMILVVLGAYIILEEGDALIG